MKLIASNYDQFTGTTEETWYDEAEGKITLRRWQDVEHTLAMNKVMFNEHSGKKPSFADVKDGVYLKARIPTSVVEKWLREDGFDWYKASEADRKKKLNSNENQKFLVRPGKI